MSPSDIAVILFGLFAGYWIVSKLFGKPSSGQGSALPADANAADPAAAWHQVLDIPADAQVEQIRTAYKTLISQYHPDKVAALGPELQSVAERKTKEINAAYAEAMRLRGDTP